MQTPAALNVSASPAPVIKSSQTKVTYEDICRAAHCSALTDFYREKRYWTLRQKIKRTGADVQVIKLTDEQADALVRSSTSRLLKEHDSASWGAFLYQAGVFGLTGISSVCTATGFYMTIYYNRLFLPIGPIFGVITWRLWNVLEEAWAQQRYIDNAARLRDERKGNPMNQVVKRRRRKGEPEEDDSTLALAELTTS